MERQKPERSIILPESAGQEYFDLVVKDVGPDCESGLEPGDAVETIPGARIIAFADDARKNLALFRETDIACVVTEVEDAD